MTVGRMSALANPNAEKLMQAHRELARDADKLTSRQIDRRLVEIDRLLATALADRGAVQDLVALLRTGDELDRWFLQDRLLPSRELAVADPGAFRAHHLVDLTAEQLPIKPCLALVERGCPADIPDTIGDPDVVQSISWFAGLPADDGTGRWPRNEDGEPLSHLVQVDLGAYTENLGADEPTPATLGLPTTGVLQLFHDRENYGNIDDAPGGSWQVRWIQQPTRLLDHPGDLSQDYYAPPAAMAIAMVASIPSPVDYTGPDPERYERVAEHLSSIRRDEPNLFGLEVGEDWSMTSAWEDGFESLDGAESSMGGYGYPEWTEDFAEILATKLPLTSSTDQHLLLFDIAGAGHLEDWFGDRGHLQAWIRRTDLSTHRFDQIWCIIRTD